jgi:hypothetical protein
MAEQPRPRYRWSARRSEYVYGNHKAVQYSTLRALVSQATSTSTDRLLAFYDKLERGNITVASFKLVAAQELKNMHGGLGAVAQGGVQQVSGKGWRTIEKALAYHLAYLNDLAGGIADGSITLDAKARSRMLLYGASGYSTFENSRRAMMRDAGFDMEQRVRGREKSCDVCKAQADLGFQPRGTLRDIGDSPCGNNCDCHFEFARSDSE